MTKEEIEEINKEFNEMRGLIQQLSVLSLQVHAAAEKALRAYSPEGDENGRQPATS